MFSKNLDEYFTGFSIGDLEEIEMLLIKSKKGKIRWKHCESIY